MQPEDLEQLGFDVVMQPRRYNHVTLFRQSVLDNPHEEITMRREGSGVFRYTPTHVAVSLLLRAAGDTPEAILQMTLAEMRERAILYLASL